MNTYLSLKYNPNLLLNCTLFNKQDHTTGVAKKLYDELSLIAAMNQLYHQRHLAPLSFQKSTQSMLEKNDKKRNVTRSEH